MYLDLFKYNILSQLEYVFVVSFSLLSIVIQVWRSSIILLMPQDAKEWQQDWRIATVRCLTTILHKTDSCKVTTASLYLTGTLDEAPQTASFRSPDSRTGVPFRSVLGSHCHLNHCLTASSGVTVIGECEIGFDLSSSQPCGRLRCSNIMDAAESCFL